MSRESTVLCLVMIALTIGLQVASAVTVGWPNGNVTANAGGSGPSNGQVYHPGDPVAQTANASASADIAEFGYEASGCITLSEAEESCTLNGWPGNQPRLVHNGSVNASGPVDFIQQIGAMAFGSKIVTWEDIGEHTARRSARALASGFNHQGNGDTGEVVYDSGLIQFSVQRMGPPPPPGGEGDLGGLLGPDEQS